ncbi:phosphotransacetylase family protein [Desulfallas sp. Bu1-1]|uniref:phosphotransacetylase family protein n=1 Tax=Desulfallas sp. Bu1-1 TaxID=2787620 RepID=UPI00189E918D|nr:phosphotransacetylase family protein [Desulfallas sp. Bu1-1]MBF7082190.1 phosphotransacetylase family protein [Desulfallas sp. Bu1-1]
MKNLYIIGNPDSGKTAVALGLALKFKELGYRVGYFKPVDTGRKSASGKIPGGDAVLMKHVLEMEAPVGLISPAKAGPSYLSRPGANMTSLREIRSAFDEISRDCDVVLVEGAIYPYAMSSVGLDPLTLAREFGSQIITVMKVENDFSLDQAIFYNRYMAQRQTLAGTVFNNVPRPLLAKTEGVFKPILEEAGFKTLGVIPSRPEISAPTVSEYQERLGADVLVGQENMDRLVEDVVVGAMTMESALTYLRRAANKAVVLGGDRSDLALAALETHTSVLILTGGLYPNVKVLARAGEKGVPVLLTHQDTYTVIEMLGQVSRHLKPNDQAGIDVARDNVNRYCDWQQLVKALEL